MKPPINKGFGARRSQLFQKAITEKKMFTSHESRDQQPDAATGANLEEQDHM